MLASPSSRRESVTSVSRGPPVPRSPCPDPDRALNPRRAQLRASMVFGVLRPFVSRLLQESSGNPVANFVEFAARVALRSPPPRHHELTQVGRHYPDGAQDPRVWELTLGTELVDRLQQGCTPLHPRARPCAHRLRIPNSKPWAARHFCKNRVSPLDFGSTSG